MTRRQQRAGYDYPTLLREVIIERRGIDELALIAGVESSGILDACHAIPKDTLSQAFPFGAIWSAKDGRWFPATRPAAIPADNESKEHRSLGQVLMDHRLIVLGSRDVHTAWDNHLLIVPWSDLPAHVREATADYGLRWWSETYYDRRVAA